MPGLELTLPQAVRLGGWSPTIAVMCWIRWLPAVPQVDRAADRGPRQRQG